MSSTEPPAGSTPPPGGEPTPPPTSPTPPPADAGAAPPPPPPPPASTGAGYGAPPPAASAPGAATPPPAAAAGVPRPGELVDRFLARLIDGVIVGIAAGILYFIFAAIFLQGFAYSTGEWLLFYLFWGVLTAVIYVGYWAYLESSRGQTIGKQVMKLKVFGPDGATNPTMQQAVRRNIWLAYPLIYIIPIIGLLIGGLAALAAVILIAVGINSDTVRRQHWFDKFAGGTQVMKIG